MSTPDGSQGKLPVSNAVNVNPPNVINSGCLRHTPPKSFRTDYMMDDDHPELSLNDTSIQLSDTRNNNTNVGPFIIGVTGASASGKTTVCEKIIDGLGDQRCVLISLDWFYYGLPEGINPKHYNFDHPDAFDYSALKETLETMSRRCPVSVPMYNFKKHARDEHNAVELDVADVIIIEGILSFYDPDIRSMMHMKIFVDEDADICLARRISRDTRERGRDVDSILNQYKRFVKPSFEEFIQPTKRYADIVVPRGGDNLVAIDLIIKHIALKIQQTDLRKVFSNLVIMSDSYQIRGLHTIIRSKQVDRDEMVFYSNRLMRLLIEEGLGLLPFKRKTITTPTEHVFYGVGFTAGIIGLSLMPDGGTMENSLRNVCNTVRIGKMLIGDGEESNIVKYEKLPCDLKNKYILVLAPVMNSGTRCETALSRLIGEELQCREDRVIVISLIVSPQAVRRICSKFPKIRLVVSSVDRGLDENGKVIPGIGDFGKRYFGINDR